MKKNVFLGAVFAAPLMAGAAFAADLPPVYEEAPAAYVTSQWDAFISAKVGYSWFDSDSDVTGPGEGYDADDWGFEARSSGAYTWANGIGFQGDLLFAWQNLGELSGEGETISFDSKSADAAAHLFFRQPDSWLVGVFAQYGVTSLDFDFLGLDIDRGYLGLEGQAYLGAFTLYAQGGYATADFGGYLGGPGGGVDGDGFFLNGQVRWFAAPNWMIAGVAGYQTLEFDGVGGLGGGGGDIDVWNVGLNTEYRLDNSPISLTLSYDYSNTDFGGGFETDENRVMAGIKLNLGTQTLIERDRAGASLDPVRPATMVLGFPVVN